MLQWNIGFTKKKAKTVGSESPKTINILHLELDILYPHLLPLHIRLAGGYDEDSVGGVRPLSILREEHRCLKEGEGSRQVSQLTGLVGQFSYCH